MVPFDFTFSIIGIIRSSLIRNGLLLKCSLLILINQVIRILPFGKLIDNIVGRRVLPSALLTRKAVSALRLIGFFASWHILHFGVLWNMS